jgi:hypothetical protein
MLPILPPASEVVEVYVARYIHHKVVFEGPVRSGFFPFWDATATATGSIKLTN